MDQISTLSEASKLHLSTFESLINPIVLREVAFVLVDVKPEATGAPANDVDNEAEHSGSKQRADDNNGNHQLFAVNFDFGVVRTNTIGKTSRCSSLRNLFSQGVYHCGQLGVGLSLNCSGGSGSISSSLCSGDIIRIGASLTDDRNRIRSRFDLSVKGVADVTNMPGEKLTGDTCQALRVVDSTFSFKFVPGVATLPRKSRILIISNGIIAI